MKAVYRTSAKSGTTKCRKGDIIRLCGDSSFFNGKEQSKSKYYVGDRLLVSHEDECIILKFF